MAALTFTAASVRLYGGIQETLIAGGTLARGNVIRKNTSNQAVVTSNDSAANADAYGVVLADAAANQPVPIAVLSGGGELEGVATNGIVGHPVVCGTAGAMLPVDDITTEFVTVVAVQMTAARLKLGKIAGGVASASNVA